MSELPIYDEQEAISHIRALLPANVNDRYSDKDLLDIINALWDHYDAVGETSLDNITDDEEEEKPEDIAAAMIEILAKKGPKAINLRDLTLIIKGEIDYEENLGADF